MIESFEFLEIKKKWWWWMVVMPCNRLHFSLFFSIIITYFQFLFFHTENGSWTLWVNAMSFTWSNPKVFILNYFFVMQIKKSHIIGVLLMTTVQGDPTEPWFWRYVPTFCSMIIKCYITIFLLIVVSFFLNNRSQRLGCIHTERKCSDFENECVM